jgi:methylmalonyl-CoA mutase
MSSTPEKLFADFPPVSTAEWEAAIAKDLKGRDPKTLGWKTEEQIEVKPFYRAEDIQGLPVSESPLAGRSWHVGCEASDVEMLRYAVDRGAQALIVPAPLAGEVPVEQVSIHVKARAGDLKGLSASATGSFNIDPIADVTQEEALEHYTAARANFPGMTPLVVDATRFHNMAASATQELAFAIGTGAECIAELQDRAAAGHIIFSFGIGSNYFFEIAKLRAARLLWRQVVSAFHSDAKAEIRIHAHTSKWNKAAYDAHVNLLRATTEAMAAVIGGCEMLNVGAFDQVWKTASDFSQRLAINTQILLREEAHFGKSGDPAAGSWYIESITDSLARSAWKLFQEIEAQGGMRKALAGGFVDRSIEANRAKRETAIATRKRSFIGVNQYPNAGEHAPPELIERGLPNSRGPYPFEAIRLATDRHAARTGTRPSIFLARIGDNKMRRARAEFAANYFACGGFAIVDSLGFDSPAELIVAVNTADPALVVLCSSDAEYPALAAALCPYVKKRVIVAGYPKDLVESLKAAGVADLVYLGSNAVEVLSRWQKNLGVTS